MFKDASTVLLAKIILAYLLFQAYYLICDIKRFRQERATQNVEQNINITAPTTSKIKNNASRNSKKD